MCTLMERLTSNQMVSHCRKWPIAADLIHVSTLKPPPSLSSVLPSLVAVAVAKRSSKNVSIRNLQGRRSCHGHMYSPAGWLLPYRHVLSPEHNDSSPCDPNQGAALTQSFSFTSQNAMLHLFSSFVCRSVCS